MTVRAVRGASETIIGEGGIEESTESRQNSRDGEIIRAYFRQCMQIARQWRLHNLKAKMREAGS
jgi:hypothetical protein